MRRITVAALMEADPCDDYQQGLVEELWEGRDALDATEIADLDIPVKDRLWAVLHCCLDDRQRRSFAFDCIEAVWKQLGPPEQASREAVRVSRLYVDGKATVQELAVVRHAVKESAKRSGSIWYVVYAAWASAAEDDKEAAWATARYAALAIGWDDAREAQLKNAVKYAREVEP